MDICNVERFLNALPTFKLRIFGWEKHEVEGGGWKKKKEGWATGHTSH